MADDRRQRLHEMIETHALRRAPEGRPFTLASGRQSTFFFDGKAITLRADGLRLVAELLLERLAEHDLGAVGGVAIGADPIVSAMVVLSADSPQPLQGFLVRKEVKGHGLGDRIAGPSLDGVARVALVEDTTTTGGSAMVAVDALRQFYPAVAIDRVLCIIDRQEGAADRFALEGLAFEALFTAADFEL